MRLLIQRVKKASVEVNSKLIASINQGLVIFVGFSKLDKKVLDGHYKDMDKLIQKSLCLRLWSKELEANPSQCISKVGGSILLISQFTLYADCRKGTRPSFSDALSVDLASQVYDIFVERFRSHSNIPIYSGIFQAYMQVSLINDGPFTLCLESKESQSSRA